MGRPLGNYPRVLTGQAPDNVLSEFMFAAITATASADCGFRTTAILFKMQFVARLAVVAQVDLHGPMLALRCAVSVKEFT
jgi:hypothetical protein